MTYDLGVDLGTTYTAAAIHRDGRVEIVGLGIRAPVIPSVLLLREDEEMLTGEAANRRAASEPERVAREFKRRMGDPAPIIVGGTPYSATSLSGKLLRWVVDKVTELEGGPPAHIVVSHPANWGAYKTDLLEQAIQAADLDDVVTITEPEAAAIHYASQTRVEEGSIVAVYDLGGGTFDAAVLRKTASGFEILGEPQGVERLGGIDFDEAVFQHVVRSAGGAIEALDPEDPKDVAALVRLRAECIEAKEILSGDTEAVIPVILPNLQTEVRLTRSEFEHLVRPALTDSITSLNRSLRSAGVEPGEVSSVLLVGGSSRIPLVGQLVSSELGRPVAVDAHPKHSIALGAAILASQRGDSEAAAPVVASSEREEIPPEPIVPDDPADTADAADPGLAAEPAGAAPEESAPEAEIGTITEQGAAAPTFSRPEPVPLAEDDDGGGRKPPVPLLLGAGAVVLVLVVGAFLLFGGGGDDEEPLDAADRSATSEAPATSETTDAPTEATAPTGPFVTLDDVVLDDGRFLANYSVANFTPLRAENGGGPDSLHLHLFLNTTAPENAGNNGTPPGDWDLTDEPSSFLTKFTPADVGGATQMCAVVATVDHNVFDPESGTCADLPL